MVVRLAENESLLSNEIEEKNSFKFSVLLNSVSLIFRYMFDMPEKEAEELRSIRKIDLIEWYHTYLIRPSPKCRRLCVRVWGCNTSWKDTDAPVASAQDIKDLTSFKKSAKFYPSLC